MAAIRRRAPSITIAPILYILFGDPTPGEADGCASSRGEPNLGSRDEGHAAIWNCQDERDHRRGFSTVFPCVAPAVAPTLTFVFVFRCLHSLRPKAAGLSGWHAGANRPLHCLSHILAQFILYSPAVYVSFIDFRRGPKVIAHAQSIATLIDWDTACLYCVPRIRPTHLTPRQRRLHVCFNLVQLHCCAILQCALSSAWCAPSWRPFIQNSQRCLNALQHLIRFGAFLAFAEAPHSKCPTLPNGIAPCHCAPHCLIPSILFASLSALPREVCAKHSFA